jgi:hypothetical protein
MTIRRKKQFSVYLENRVGALAGICRIIASQSINLIAICAIDTVEEAVLRIVPEDEPAAKRALEASGFRVIETEVLVVELPNVPGATGKMAGTLAENSINIDYIYASTHPEEKKTLLILRTHAIDDAQRILAAA